MLLLADHKYVAVPLLSSGRADRPAGHKQQVFSLPDMQIQSAMPCITAAWVICVLQSMSVDMEKHNWGHKLLLACPVLGGMADTRLYRRQKGLNQQVAECQDSRRGLECTGTLIGPKHVVTAAHCVFDINDSRQYVSSLNFAPGETSQNNLPFGTAQWSSVRVLSQFTSQVRQFASPAFCISASVLGIRHTWNPSCPWNYSSAEY